MIESLKSHLRSLPVDIYWFLGIMYAISGICMYQVIRAGDFGVSGGIYAIGGMWSPGISALIVALVFRLRIRDFGWKWGKTRYQVISFLLPIFYIGVGYAIVWATGLGGMTDMRPEDMIVQTLTAVLPWNTMVYVMVLGEEIGWSGYFVPRLAQSGGFRKAALMRGIVWSTWHAPLILGGVYGPDTLPVWYKLLTFTIMAFSLSVAFTWLRLISGSLWTGMFMHAAHNKFIQGIFPKLTTDTGVTKYFQDEFSIFVVLASIAIAVIFWRKGKHLSPGLSQPRTNGAPSTA